MHTRCTPAGVREPQNSAGNRAGPSTDTAQVPLVQSGPQSKIVYKIRETSLLPLWILVALKFVRIMVGLGG